MALHRKRKIIKEDESSSCGHIIQTSQYRRSYTRIGFKFTFTFHVIDSRGLHQNLCGRHTDMPMNKRNNLNMVWKL